MPLANSIIDCTLLQLHNTGKWDNFVFKEGVRVLLSCSLIKLDSSKGVYTMHPLIHAWGRDRMSSEDRQKYCSMAYGMLACSLPEDFNEQPYQFRIVFAGPVAGTEKKTETELTQLTATGPSVAVASFGSSFGCRLSYFLKTRKPTKDRSQSVATGLLTVYILCTIYTVKTNII